ncbi:MAG: YtxH domain-containing protein [Thermodesulfobacteriota bacterium]|nr:YtxH domain-containing protein [Thermodesulfobacteriota bacterium]
MEQLNITENQSLNLKETKEENADISKEVQVHQEEPGGIASWFAFTDSSYLKGFAAAAGITLLISSPTVREKITKGGIKAWAYLQSGVEEFKEKVQDVRAEMSEQSPSSSSEQAQFSSEE